MLNKTGTFMLHRKEVAIGSAGQSKRGAAFSQRSEIQSIRSGNIFRGNSRLELLLAF